MSQPKPLPVPRTLAMATALTLGLSACGGSATAEDDGGKPVVLTTFTVLADIADNVAGEHLEVESITKVGAEIHGYEPTPGDIRKAAKADLVLDNGLNLEQWFSQFVDDIGLTPSSATASTNCRSPATPTTANPTRMPG